MKAALWLGIAYHWYVLGSSTNKVMTILESGTDTGPERKVYLQSSGLKCGLYDALRVK